MAKGGPCGIWAMKDGDYEAHVFEGTSAGLTAALAYVGSNGVVHVYPGSSTVTIPTVAAGVRLTKHEAGVESTYGPSTTEYSRTGKRKNREYNVLDYADVATAIAAVPLGGVLYFPKAGGPYVAPAAGWDIDKGIEIYSDGQAMAHSEGFQFANSAAAGNTGDVVFNLLAGCDGFYLHDFVISNNSGTPAAGGTGDAIRYDGASTLENVVIERGYIAYAGRSGVRLTGNAAIVRFSMRDVKVYGCRGSGIYVSNGNQLSFDAVSAIECDGAGFDLVNSGNIAMSACNTEGNCDDLVNTTYDAQIKLTSCSSSHIHGCNVEDIGAATVENGIVLNDSYGIVIGGNDISIVTPTAGSCGIRLANATRGCTVESNTHNLVDKLVEIDSATDIGNIVLPQMTVATHANGPGRVVIPTGLKNFVFYNNLTAGVADNKGVGILFPSMADTSAVSTAVTQDGLVVYDSTNAQMRFRIGGAWYSAVVSAT